MKIDCLKNDLVQALHVVSRAISSKPRTPILSGILLKAENGELELRATDFEIAIVSRIPADVQAEGTVIVSGRYLQEVTRNVPASNVVLETVESENSMLIRSGSALFKLLVMNSEHDEFPNIARITGRTTFTISDVALKKLIRKTAFACSTDDARPIFTGCLLELGDGCVRMAATNTHRLAYAEAAVEGMAENSRRIIIPGRILAELRASMTSEVPTPVTIDISDNDISFSFERIYLKSSLISGQFPDYHRVIPTSFETRVTLDTAEFLAAVNRISLISRASDYNSLRLAFSAGQVHISSNNPDIGQAEESVRATIDGPDVTIAFNAAYMTDVLKVTDSKEIYLSLTDALKPGAVREPNNDDFIYVVTPVRMQQR